MRKRAAAASASLARCEHRGSATRSCPAHGRPGILLVVLEFADAGGIEEQTVQVAAGLKSAGCEVGVFCCEPVRRHNQYHRYLAHERIRVFRGRRVSRRSLELVERIAQAASLPVRVALSAWVGMTRRVTWSEAWRTVAEGIRWRVRALLERLRDAGVCSRVIEAARAVPADLVQVNGGVALARVFGGVQSAHPVVFRETGEPARLGPSWDWLGPALREVDAIIAPTQAQADQLVERFGELTAPVFVVPNVVRGPRDEPIPSGGSQPASIIGTMGRLSREKGHRYLLTGMQRVTKHHPGTRLLIAGDGREAGDLSELAASLGLASHVTFLGHLPREDLDGFMSRLDVFVMPSLSEGFGIALVEAMAHAKAVVATRVGGMVGHIEHGVNGLLVPAADPDALADAIITLVEDEALRARLGKQARRTYERQYAPSAVLRQLLDVYEYVWAARSIATRSGCAAPVLEASGPTRRNVLGGPGTGQGRHE